MATKLRHTGFKVRKDNPLRVPRYVYVEFVRNCRCTHNCLHPCGLYIRIGDHAHLITWIDR